MGRFCKHWRRNISILLLALVLMGALTVRGFQTAGHVDLSRLQTNRHVFVNGHEVTDQELCERITELCAELEPLLRREPPPYLWTVMGAPDEHYLWHYRSQHIQLYSAEYTYGLHLWKEGTYWFVNNEGRLKEDIVSGDMVMFFGHSGPKSITKMQAMGSQTSEDMEYLALLPPENFDELYALASNYTRGSGGNDGVYMEDYEKYFKQYHSEYPEEYREAQYRELTRIEEP